MAKIILKREKGTALIISVGILALMALIATSFAVNMQLEHKIAANFRDSLKARYLAESGINRAIAELAYGTEGAINTTVDTEGEKWYASEPYRDDTLLDSKGSYAVTKIRDCASQIYINDANPNLSAVLENLVSAPGSPLTPGDGNAIVANRPSGGYTTKEQIKAVPEITETKYNAIKDYISVYAFVDSDVINLKDTTTPYAASPRAPINVNTASKEVLFAVLKGISDGTNSISESEANELAQHLINGRSYSTYDELWIRLLTAETLGLIGTGDAAVAMANANPNTDLMRANPNYTWRYKHISKEGYDGVGVPRAVDKTMLTTSTTEFCFSSGGYFEIESTGIIRGKAGNRVAERKIMTIVKIFDIWRQTTQAQFAQGVKSGVQTYPEFDYESSTISPANYDGQVMLATLTEISPSSGLHFRVNFNEDKNGVDDDLNADSSGGGLSSQTAYPGTNPNVNSIANPSNNGNLFPDGVFISQNENEVDLSYACTNQGISNTRGTVEIWLKPNWSGNEVSFPKDPWNSGIIFQTSDYGNYWTSTMSIDVWANDKKIVTKFHPSDAATYGLGYYYWIGNSIANWKPGEWHHIALTWDFPAVSQKLFFDGNEVASTTAPVGPNPFTAIRLGVDSEKKEMVDSTVDEVRVFDSLRDVTSDFAAGRYYSGPDEASFESSENPIGNAMLGTISWTEHTRDKDGLEIFPGADIQFDIFDGSIWMGDYENRSNPAGMPLKRPTTGAGNIKYRAYFKNSATTLLDTPVLDDVTITYIKAIEILYWREET
ncbi:MAG: LamG-like jellyroll fold domain-containing protein [Candidatus Omnitrophota bacterium]|nr:LamG-like jellyroll fold domain-containing protein [Candidatus Omnitrophota bacterium]